MSTPVVNHDQNPQQLGLVALMQTPAYSSIEFHHTDADAKAAIDAGAAESPPRAVMTLVFSNPLNPDTNCFGVCTSTSDSTKRTRHVVYDVKAYQAAVQVYANSISRGGPKKASDVPDPSKYPASFVGELAVIGNSSVGNLGNHQRESSARAFGSAPPKPVTNAEYCLSVLDAPWCEKDCVSDMGGSKGFARQSRFFERLEVWIALAFTVFSMNTKVNTVSDQLMSRVAAALEKQAQTGVVAPKKKISSEQQKAYKRAIELIKRSQNLSKEELEELDAVPLVISGDTIKHVPSEILIAAAKSVLAEDGTRHILYTPPGSAGRPSSGPMITVRTKVFTPGNTPDKIKKMFDEANGDPARHPFLTPEVRAVVQSNSVFFFSPPKVKVMKREGSGLALATMPIVNGEYPPITKGSVGCVGYTIRLSMLEGRLNIGLGFEQVVLVYPPSVLATRFRYTNGERVNVVIPDNELLFPPGMEQIGGTTGGAFISNANIPDDAFASVDLDNLAAKRSATPAEDEDDRPSKLRRIGAPDMLAPSGGQPILLHVPTLEECE